MWEFLYLTPPRFLVLDTVTSTLNYFDGRQPEYNYRWILGSNESERLNISPPDPHEVVVHDLGELSDAFSFNYSMGEDIGEDRV